MANSGPHTNGSQFFFSLRQSPHLDEKYVAFGQVVAGLDVLFCIQNVQTDEDGHPIKVRLIGQILKAPLFLLQKN